MKMEKSTLIHLPLQYFAEGGDGAGASSEGTPASSTEPVAPPSFDDMLKANKELQAEFDRRVTKAQETALTNAKAEWEKQAQAEKEEAARVAKMNADEKAKHEREKQEKALAEREAANDKREAAIAKREMSADAIEKLAAKGLPAELYKCLDYTSAESCEASFDAVVSAFNAAVEKQVNDKLRGATPPAAPAQAGGTTKFGSIADALRAEAAKKN